VTVTSETDMTVSATTTTAAVTATAKGTIGITATASESVTADNTGATAGDDVTLTNATAAKTVNVTSVGNIATTAALAGLETATLSIAEASTINITAASDAVLNLTTSAADIAYTITATADDFATIAASGDNDMIVNVTAAAVTGETVTKTGTGVLTLNVGTAAAVDLTNVANNVTTVLNDDFATFTVTAADTGQTLVFGADQAGATTIAAETAANTANSITLATTAARALTTTTITDYANVTLDSSDGAFTIGGHTTGDQLAKLTLIGDNAVDFQTFNVRNTATTPAAVELDASALTAALTLDLNGASGGIETIQGSTVVDTIDAAAAANHGTAYTINTNAGADSITVRANADSTINAGTGNDNIVMAGAADVTIDGGSGIDTLTINANVDLSASTLNLTSVEQIQLVGGGLTQTLAASYITGKSFLISESGGGNADLTISMDQTSVDLSGLGFASSFETVNDGITINASGLGLSATIVGSAADDTITGTSGADSITAGGGADTINAGGGADTINLSETTALVDTVIFDSTSGNDQITGFSFAGDIIQLDRSALGLGSGDDTVDAAEVDASTGTLTAAADILILSTAAGYATNNAMETAIQAIYAAGGGSGAGDAVIVYYNSTSEEIVMVYDDDLDVDGGATATIATFVGTDAGDLSDITAADFSFIA
jgi:hypothetical protein